MRHEVGRRAIRLAECQGGPDGNWNVVAACRSCNSVRARMDHRVFYEHRLRFIESGAWPACTWPCGRVISVLRPLQALARYRIDLL